MHRNDTDIDTVENTWCIDAVKQKILNKYFIVCRFKTFICFVCGLIFHGFQPQYKSKAAQIKIKTVVPAELFL